MTPSRPTCERILRLSTFALTAAVFAGCSASAGDPASPTAPAATDSDVAKGPSEEARVEAYLATGYRAEDVRHAFESAEGKAIDCIDFAAEPGVRAMAAEGYSLDQIRKLGELTDEQRAYNLTAPRAPAAFGGEPDAQGSARVCPDGTVAHERVTKEQIRAAGGLTAFIAGKHPRKTAPPAALPQNGTAGCPYVALGNFQWVESGWSSTANQGGTATFSIVKPTVSASGDHSLAETWTIGTSGCEVQTVEAGWTVDPALNGDMNPHVFIFATASTYGSGGGGTGGSGCFDNHTFGPYEGNCVPWVPITSLASIPALPASVPGGVQHEITFSTTHIGETTVCHPSGNYIVCLTTFTGWQIAMQVDGGAWQSLGYYQNSAFGNGPLSQGATAFELGTEVLNSVGNANVVFGSPNVTMGEDAFPATLIARPTTVLYGKYAYFRNYSITPASVVPPDAPQGYVGVGETAYTCSVYGKCVYDFTSANVGAPGAPSWTNWSWYGDNYSVAILR